MWLGKGWKGMVVDYVRFESGQWGGDLSRLAASRASEAIFLADCAEKTSRQTPSIRGKFHNNAHNDCEIPSHA